MGEGQFGRVQHQARRGAAGEGQGAAVAGVSGQRTADRGHVDAKLVHPPGGRVQLDQGAVVRGGKRAVPAQRGLGAGRVGGDGAHIALAADLLPQQRRFDGSGLRVRCGRQQGQIGLLEAPRLHGLAQKAGGGLGFGRQDDARGVAVQPVHQIRPFAV